ncbi:FAD binding domain-containing protein [Mycolicibacterium boenickei]
MRPARFEYIAPTNIDSAVRALDQAGSMVLAGGQSLIAAMNTRKARPRILVDVNHIEGLGNRELFPNYIRLGAMRRHRQVEKDADLKEWAAALADAAALVGDPAIRRRGTLGGSLVHADPGAHLPAAVLLLDADVELTGPRYRRRVKVAHFLHEPFRPAIRSSELLVAVRVPLAASGQSSAFCEATTRSTGTRICAGTMIELDESGTCVHARVVLTGTAPKPWCLAAATGDLAGEQRLSAPLRRRWADWLLSQAHAQWGQIEADRQQLIKHTAIRSVVIAWQRNSNARRP